MLVARRDPPLNGDYEHPRGHGYFHGHGHHNSRFMTAVQVIGTLVGIPVGLASVYSIYHSNFTVEARCETLRGGIISMLDKSADASTLRMLVRRDVVTFETNCASVDPDAVKAFKTLLAEKTPAAAPVARTAPAPAPAPKAQPQQAARDAHPVEPVKQAAPAKAAPVPPETKAVEVKPVEAKPAETMPAETKPVEAKSVEAKPVHRDAETSDAKWVSSVRDALVHAPAHDDAAVAPAPAPVVAPAVQPLPPPPAPPMPAEAAREPAPTPMPPRAIVESPAAAPPAPPQARVVREAPPVSLAPPAAPALPDPVPVAAAPAPTEAKPTDKPDDKSGHSWMADMPILNRVVGH